MSDESKLIEILIAQSELFDLNKNNVDQFVREMNDCFKYNEELTLYTTKDNIWIPRLIKRFNNAEKIPGGVYIHFLGSLESLYYRRLPKISFLKMKGEELCRGLYISKIGAEKRSRKAYLKTNKN